MNNNSSNSSFSYKEEHLKMCAIMEGLLPHGAEMTDEIRAEAEKKLDYIGWPRIRKDAD